VKNAFRTGERIYLRPLELEDLEFLQSLVGSEEIQQYIGVYWPLNGIAESAWLEGLYKDKEKFPFGIALKEGNQLIGSCELRLGFAAHRNADLGIGIGGPEFQGKGYGAEAIGLLLEYGFATLGMHRIGLSVFENNARGIRCYEKCGFRREGLRREARWWAGRWWNILEYGILAQEWQTLSPRNAAK
jgi:RimJ/RimL family protein N-acetyltransferase